MRRDAPASANAAEPLLVGPLRHTGVLLDRLVLALALAPRPGDGRESPLTPAWRRRRARARR